VQGFLRRAQGKTKKQRRWPGKQLQRKRSNLGDQKTGSKMTGKQIQ
jgi:hypothetical protein